MAGAAESGDTEGTTDASGKARGVTSLAEREFQQDGEVDRLMILLYVRAELRANHPRLTEQQIDLVAGVAVELRLTRIRLGLPTVPISGS
jgi:nitroreductase